MPFGGACLCFTTLSENIICIGVSSGTEALSTEVLVQGSTHWDTQEQPVVLLRDRVWLSVAYSFFSVIVGSYQWLHMTKLFQIHSCVWIVEEFVLFVFRMMFWMLAIAFVVCLRTNLNRSLEAEWGNTSVGVRQPEHFEVCLVCQSF